MPEINAVASSVLNYGALVVFFAVSLGLIVHWYVKRYPKELAERNKLFQVLLEQVALSRQALETSNQVITQNTSEMAETRASHIRLGERMGGMEDSLVRHDARAEEIAKDTTVIRGDTLILRQRVEHLI
jgi:uncharacterized coiled-coil protein SlyX